MKLVRKLGHSRQGGNPLKTRGHGWRTVGACCGPGAAGAGWPAQLPPLGPWECRTQLLPTRRPTSARELDREWGRVQGQVWGRHNPRRLTATRMADQPPSKRPRVSVRSPAPLSSLPIELPKSAFFSGLNKHFKCRGIRFHKDILGPREAHVAVGKERDPLSRRGSPVWVPCWPWEACPGTGRGSWGRAWAAWGGGTGTPPPSTGPWGAAGRTFTWVPLSTSLQTSVMMMMVVGLSTRKPSQSLVYGSSVWEPGPEARQPHHGAVFGLDFAPGGGLLGSAPLSAQLACTDL